LRCLFLGETMMALPDKAPLLLLLRVDDRKQFQFVFFFVLKGKKSEGNLDFVSFFFHSHWDRSSFA
jgi:hypothetical protein